MSTTDKLARKVDDPDLYDSGVTNGDVDWLFRGKSKKLTKKMNLNKDIEKDTKDPKDSKDSKAPATPVPPEPSRATDSPKQPVESLPPTAPSSQDSPQDPSQDPAISPTDASGSRLNKLFRPRSGSLTKGDKKEKPKEKPKEKKFNLMSYSVLGAGIPVSPLATMPAAPRVRSRSSSVGSNSSAASKDKKSLFSSLSSKFKSVPPSSPTSVGPHEQVPASDGSPKLNTNFFGKDDISQFHAKPPAELSGIPIKRKNSVQEQVASSADKLSSSANSFNSFFKRRTSTSSATSQSSTCPPGSSRLVLNKNPHKEKSPLKELEGVSLKRVNFAIDKLLFDPQQQIPSRRPKKGNVLIPEDLTAPPPRLLQGTSLNDCSSTKAGENKFSDKELTLAVEAQRRALIEAEKHAQEAHISAKRIAFEVSQYKIKPRLSQITTEETVGGASELDEEPVSSEGQDFGDARNIEIDKPLHLHEKHFEEDTYHSDVSNLTLEQIYTRCCHLREILPIPATLKQLKNKSKPLSVLKLLNPKPTLIDILSFSDFIAIVPITTVIFDNVTMTTEMLKHLLASLAYNKSVEKLSLRNVPIDKTGWKYLCSFLSRNHSVKKLDISQQRIKSDLKPSLIRSSMNWDLFTKSLVTRGGTEELVINGCKLTDEVFKELVEKAVYLSTFRLGIASCELNGFKTNLVCEWLKSPDCKCVGVDVAFNDLSQGQLKYFTDCFNHSNVKLIFFSLYQTNLSNIEETAELLKALTKIKTLRFLDLSSLPDLFPGIISKLNAYLPKFENLKRIHFDLNDLTSQSMIAISEILPKVNGLLHISLLGNRNLNNSVAASIYNAIKKSNSIFALDLDYDLISDQLNQRMAFYLMRNMDHSINVDPSTGQRTSKDYQRPKDQEEEELMFDGSLLMETAERLLSENENSSNKVEDIRLNNIISNALIERTRELRQGIHKTIDTLFDKRNTGTLSLEGKESLLRFCLLDASLEKLVHLFEEQASKSGAEGMSPSPSVDEDLASPTTKLSKSTSLLSKKDGLPTIDLGDKELMHQSSTELITSGPILSPRNTETLNKLGYFQSNNESLTFQPHQVVVESDSEGQTFPIDYLTGRPVLMRSISQTSTHAKEQELEEGEFHRWGFFMQQRNNSSTDLQNQTKEEPKKPQRDHKSLPTLNVLPSGGELRDAIIRAKGIESITELIDKINDDRVSLEKIYSVADKSQQVEIERQLESLRLEEEKHKSQADVEDDAESIDSMGSGHEVNAVVDEVYDKLLNDAERVRSNK
ncbi:hypothetical protein CANTEDRAFT_111208 [Yamadazyma tenuis ATCC 10573]|uniref:RNI-like protein n=1 Tax=Candida tenuis (strain ATCC 10573 / BCRC 21748 / CBS 615 / JCM 9827 / NBRC 10315 / NRRL Y-1498 / VKM Y-70) TaxID=590646 RepID=G3BEI5_CANTC|nr:uncharacterized protein CANTEDRAFT_111208 [Yamadazyma tenuis ATCC 10573]XP_006689765.1 uncharacterized protein CANTEDRAFT_111208 [Yamadazyma tenuis ATCC 10573]EGV60550.1 hypothetical protein CANTEDRAFT_111208 [Yamadazyma tenuis ATCC 10573]EGV60551.1 hypothetical protein CANTEDRAFT_111208 [Yamadazyma tenuis ATCC 10573]